LSCALRGCRRQSPQGIFFGAKAAHTLRQAQGKAMRTSEAIKNVKIKIQN
jgi:hypothetical protein